MGDCLRVAVRRAIVPASWRQGSMSCSGQHTTKQAPKLSYDPVSGTWSPVTHVRRSSDGPAVTIAELPSHRHCDEQTRKWLRRWSVEAAREATSRAGRSAFGSFPSKRGHFTGTSPARTLSPIWLDNHVRGSFHCGCGGPRAGLGRVCSGGLRPKITGVCGAVACKNVLDCLRARGFGEQVALGQFAADTLE